MLAFYRFLDPIIFFLRVPKETVADMHTYLFYVFFGFFATFLYNYFSNVLRGIGNSAIPLLFLAVSVVLNIFLDLYCVIVLHWGIMGAALATAASQCVSGIGITVYFLKKFPQYRVTRRDMCWNRENLRSILSLSGCTCLQQSVMNFGILLVQGIVNSFGTAVMAAFAVAVKIDTIAYMPVQDFGNAFSVFVAQNYGAQKSARIASGVRCAFASVAVFCVIISSLVWLCAHKWSASVSSIYRLRAPVTLASAYCSCCMAIIAPSTARRCRWCSPSVRWVRVWRSLICCPASP